MPNLSRRHLVTTAAALPALAVPALADPASADAELISLGEKLQKLWPEYVAARAIDEELGGAACDLACQRVPGLSAYHTPEQKEAWEVEYKSAIAEPSTAAAAAKFTTLDFETDALAKKIMAIPAHTLAGLRVKAIVAVRSSWFLWEKPFDDLDWDQKGALSLMEAVCSVTGLDVAKHVGEVRS